MRFPGVMPDAPSASAVRDEQFARIALPLLPSVARVANALTRDAADADDLVQETFLRAFRHWGTFDQTSDCKRWLSAICRNTYFAQHARQRWVTAVGDDHELETFAAVNLHKLAREQGVEEMFARLDLAPAIQRAIGDLEPLYRDVVQLVDVQELRYEEAADVLGVPVGTVRSRLYRARRQLQQVLVQYAVDAGFAARAEPPPSTRPPTSVVTYAES